MYYEAYADESGITEDDEYTSVAIISGEKDKLNNLRHQLLCINNNKVDEVKFLQCTRLHSPMVKIAQACIKCVIDEFIRNESIRIDIITKSNIIPSNRMSDEIEHMYCTLFTHIARCWRKNAWNFYPDENSKIDWSNIVSSLNMTTLERKRYRQSLLVTLLEGQKTKFQFIEVQPKVSTTEPLIQLADLFSGMARFSYNESHNYQKYRGLILNHKQRRFNLSSVSDVAPILRTG